MNNCRKTSFVLAGLLALLLTVTSANLATAKGPFLTPPPISIGLYTPNGLEVTLTQAQATSIGSLV
jgi:hypothetical protein